MIRLKKHANKIGINIKEDIFLISAEFRLESSNAVSSCEKLSCCFAKKTSTVDFAQERSSTTKEIFSFPSHRFFPEVIYLSYLVMVAPTCTYVWPPKDDNGTHVQNASKYDRATISTRWAAMIREKRRLCISDVENGFVQEMMKPEGDRRWRDGLVKAGQRLKDKACLGLLRLG